MAFTKTPRAPDDRFKDKVSIDPSGCWIWKGYIDKRGYGIFGVTSKEIWKAHRYSYVMHGGEIPDGLQLDHLCRVRSCVNPEHLESVTNRENVIRGNSARPIAAACQRGHEFSEANTYINPNGRRERIACRRAAHKRFENKGKILCEA